MSFHRRNPASSPPSPNTKLLVLLWRSWLHPQVPYRSCCTTVKGLLMPRQGEKKRLQTRTKTDTDILTSYFPSSEVQDTCLAFAKKMNWITKVFLLELDSAFWRWTEVWPGNSDLSQCAFPCVEKGVYPFLIWVCWPSFLPLVFQPVT